MMRRIAAGLLFAAVLAGGIRASVLRLLLPPHRPPDAPAPAGGIDRKPLRFENDPAPAELLRFFETIRANTRRGERVGLLMAAPYSGFSYVYWRANYVLAGRVILPPIDLVAPEDADVIAVWRSPFGDPRYEIVRADADSALLRRRR
jgi:hypothetical protein